MSLSNKWKRAELFIRANSSRQKRQTSGTRRMHTNTKNYFPKQQYGELTCCLHPSLLGGVLPAAQISQCQLLAAVCKPFMSAKTSQHHRYPQRWDSHPYGNKERDHSQIPHVTLITLDGSAVGMDMQPTAPLSFPFLFQAQAFRAAVLPLTPDALAALLN